MLSFSHVWTAEPLLKAGSLINHLPAPGTAWDAADSIFISFAEFYWGICSSPRYLPHASGKTEQTACTENKGDALLGRDKNRNCPMVVILVTSCSVTRLVVLARDRVSADLHVLGKSEVRFWRELGLVRVAASGSIPFTAMAAEVVLPHTELLRETSGWHRLSVLVQKLQAFREKKKLLDITSLHKQWMFFCPWDDFVRKPWHCTSSQWWVPACCQEEGALASSGMQVIAKYKTWHVSGNSQSKSLEISYECLHITWSGSACQFPVISILTWVSQTSRQTAQPPNSSIQRYGIAPEKNISIRAKGNGTGKWRGYSTFFPPQHQAKALSFWSILSKKDWFCWGQRMSCNYDSVFASG